MRISIPTILASVSLVTAATVTYTWDVDFVTVAPDGFSRRVIGINGQWPCPPIEATVGDTVVVNVNNKLETQTTGLHFHGISQRGSTVMDGATGAGQCPIPPGSSFTYTFKIDKPGSFWYHSHNMGQYPDGLRGPLIVHDPNDPYAGQFDEELVLTTSDWYHDEVPVLLHQLLVSTNTHALPPFPNAILVNDANKAQYHLTPGKTYKIRAMGMAAFASTLLQFDSHTMRVIEVDGTYIEKHDADQIRIAPGQRYTFLLNAQSTNRRNYAFTASLDMNRDFLNDPAPIFPFNVTGYLIYDDTKSLPPPYVVDEWEPVHDFTFKALDGMGLLGTPDKIIQLDFNFGFDAQGIPRTYFNNITYVLQKVPSYFTAISTGTENTNPLIYGTVNPFIVSKGSIVQIVVNNLDAAIHPFHLHGHQFQVCELPGSGKGTFDGHTRNFPAVPMRRDVVAVNADSYAVLRFTADNPGVWLFHCHIEWHIEMGLSATIIEGPEDLRGGSYSIPDDHKAACAVQHIPTRGNAAGNTANLTDLTGANTLPLNPNNGAIYSAPGSKRRNRSGPSRRPRA